MSNTTEPIGDEYEDGDKYREELFPSFCRVCGFYTGTSDICFECWEALQSKARESSEDWNQA